MRPLPNLTKTLFGHLPDGAAADLYTLSWPNGIEARITNYGGIIVYLTAPDRRGHFEDVVLGFDNLASYTGPHPMFGAIVGRYANRIGGSAFPIDGRMIRLHPNSGPHHLHGVLHDRLWRAKSRVSKIGPALELKYASPAGEDGFPGRLYVTVVYTLLQDALRIDYGARTTKATVVNLTNHSYFNLAGAGKGDVLNTELTLFADHVTAVGLGQIPTGEISPVKGTPFDFTTPRTIGAEIHNEHEQIRMANGFDHNYVINGGGHGLTLAARAYEPASGRVMEVLTTEPGIQLYTSNTLKQTGGKRGREYGRHEGLCLETQHYPDSPNRPEFPSTLLRPGETFTSTTIYRFSTQEQVLKTAPR